MPGEGGITLESTAGNAQLELPSSVREFVEQRLTKEPPHPEPRAHAQAPGTRMGWPWGRSFEVHGEVPASGVYDVVDDDDNYLDHQITCHAGDQFPPATHEELLKRVGAGSYHYRLAYEAAHLAPDPGPEWYSGTIFLPGQEVPVSGVYDVVDKDGNYLDRQRVWVKGHDNFGPTDDAEAHGYMLAYAARHLHPG